MVKRPKSYLSDYEASKQYGKLIIIGHAKSKEEANHVAKFKREQGYKNVIIKKSFSSHQRQISKTISYFSGIKEKPFIYHIYGKAPSMGMFW